MSSHERPDLQLGDQLEAPAGDADILSVAAVGVVEVEDRLGCFGRPGDEPFVTDVDPLIGVGGEKVRARLSKGVITASL